MAEDTRKALRLHLIRRDLRPSDLAAGLGISVQYLNNILAGVRRAEPIRTRLIEEYGIPASLLRFRKRKPAPRGSELQSMPPPASPIIGQTELPSNV